MTFKRIGHKILAVVGITVTLGLAATAWFYTAHLERALLAQNERTTRKLTESVIQALDVVMMTGHADIAVGYADRLRMVPDVEDFRILSVDGVDAFRDNASGGQAEARQGGPPAPRDGASRVRELKVGKEQLKKVLQDQRASAFYDIDAQGETHLTFLAPIINHEPCFQCHDRGTAVQGILKLTTSLASAHRDIERGQRESLLVLGSVLLGTLVLTGFILGRSVVRPIERVTSAMKRASGGDLEQKVRVSGEDELAQMASSFNVMTDELRKLSTTDSLTGLFNRRLLDKSLQTELDRARRYATHLSVLMCDVDHFKKINDAHGHDQGDRVLQAVAATFRQVLREPDLPCRYGGEEFVAILPDTPKAGAYKMAERLRTQIENLSVDGLRLTISIGVAEYPDFEVSEQAKLIEAADTALYQAKNGGRNRTCIAEPAGRAAAG